MRSWSWMRQRRRQVEVLDHLVIQKLNAEGRLEKKESKKGTSMFDKNELSAILKFGAEELFKEDKNDEESKKRLESMDIDEILERAEKVETKGSDEEPGNELLSAFKNLMSDMQREHVVQVERLLPDLSALRKRICPGLMPESTFK